MLLLMLPNSGWVSARVVGRLTIHHFHIAQRDRPDTSERIISKLHRIISGCDAWRILLQTKPLAGPSRQIPQSAISQTDNTVGQIPDFSRHTTAILTAFVEGILPGERIITRYDSPAQRRP